MSRKLNLTMNELFKRKLFNLHYKLYSFLNKIVPKKNNYIFIYDAPFMRQNCWALYRYLVETGYSNRYRIFFYAEKYKNHYGKMLESGVIRNPFIGWLLHLVSKYTFYEYHNHKYCCKPGNKQISVYLTHGMPLKNYGYLVETPAHPYENDYSYLLMTSEYYIPIMKKILGCKSEQIYLGGMPRCDQLHNKCDLSWLFRANTRTVLWMPTFRQSEENGIKDSNSKFPLLNMDNIDELDHKLALEKVLLIIKPHPFQKRIAWLYDKKYDNIRILLNEDLDMHNIELYELIGRVDMLLTDYSSVYSDYLLTGNPIAFVFDDFEDYNKNRGFVDQKLIENLPGPIISDYQKFLDCLTNIERIKRDYEYSRKIAQEKLSPNPIGNSFSQDLCCFLNIYTEENNA